MYLSVFEFILICSNISFTETFDLPRKYEIQYIADTENMGTWCFFFFFQIKLDEGINRYCN